MALKLTERDRQLLAVLVQARCLSADQLRRLFWPQQAMTTFCRRMKRLERGARSLVKPVHWYTRTGRQMAWALTPAGYLEAEAELDEAVEVARDDVGVEYLEHHVLLSELFVGLLGAGRAQLPRGLTAAQRAKGLAGVFARARHPSWRWVVTGDRELPWKQPEGGALRERLLRPDAILEFPGHRRRVLIESEMGTHTIAAVSSWKPGATTGKADRYEAFASGLASVQPRRTWYQARFPDGARPEVLFLVRSEGRMQSVQAALEVWRRKHPQAMCTFQVATVEGALAEYRPLAGHSPAPARATARGEEPRTDAGAPPPAVAGGVQLSLAELAALRRFFTATHADFKARRDFARVQKTPAPDYPDGMQELHAALKRLSG